MNLYQFYITSNSGYGPKEAVRIYTNCVVPRSELKAFEELKFDEVKAICQYRYKAQLLYGHIKE